MRRGKTVRERRERGADVHNSQAKPQKKPCLCSQTSIATTDMHLHVSYDNPAHERSQNTDQKKNRKHKPKGKKEDRISRNTLAMRLSIDIQRIQHHFHYFQQICLNNIFKFFRFSKTTKLKNLSDFYNGKKLLFDSIYRSSKVVKTSILLSALSSARSLVSYAVFSLWAGTLAQSPYILKSHIGSRALAHWA